MSRYIPMPAYPDSMPVDISFVFADEKPAGKRGFVHADGDDLRFADGTLARFWGVNFNGGACFPSREYAPKVARRLAQAGVNLVRFHQLDAEWDTPNIFSFSKGKRVSTTRRLDPRSLDALDYLVFCLKEEGIYCYLDMNTYRHFKEEDGVEEYEALIDMGKPWCMIDPRMIELQKEYADQLWNHFNPYTKLLYKDDPVFVLTEIINECDIFTPSFVKKVDYTSYPKQEARFRALFRDWLAKNGKEYDWEHFDLWKDTSDTVLQFKIDTTEAFFRELYGYMRNTIGVKIPITGTNWAHTAALVKSHEEMDFTDTHHYYYDWRWGNQDRCCAHRSITSSPVVFTSMAKMKVPGKPLFVSEWDMPWPNAFRAEGPIYYAAIGALQGWAGFAIHTYAYGTRLNEMKVLGREQSTPVAGVPYREGIFSVWNDPAKFGLFYHAALITRRSDVSPAKKAYGVLARELGATHTVAYQAGGLETSRLATVFDETLPEGYEGILEEKQPFPVADPKKYVSDNGELWRDLSMQVGAVDTARTKVVYGYLGKGRGKASNTRPDITGIELDGLVVSCATDFGVIALSSLSNDPIENSKNILLSAIGRARNSGAQFDGDKMLELGHPPILAEVIDAEIHLKTSVGASLKVWGVNAEGFYAGRIPTVYRDGVLSFRIGDENNPACYYLLVAD